MCFNKKKHAKSQVKDVCSKLHLKISIEKVSKLKVSIEYNSRTKFLTLSKIFASLDFTIVNFLSVLC